MNNRIQKILNSEKLSRSQFAEIIKIQASAVTHLINGRNKPSADVLQNILKAFPQISPDWLILGTGNMYRNEQQSSISQPDSTESAKNEPFVATLFDGISDNESENDEENEITQSSEEKRTVAVATQKSQVSVPNNPTKYNFNTKNVTASEPTPQPQPQKEEARRIDSSPYVSSQPRTIKKIIIFYSDNTFEELIK